MYHQIVVACFAISTVTLRLVATKNWEPDSANVRVFINASGSSPDLEVVQTSPTSGFIQTPGWGVLPLHPKNMDSVVHVQVPETHSAMVTMLNLNLTGKRMACKTSQAKLAVYKINMTQPNLLWYCEGEIPVISRQRLPTGADMYVHFQCGNIPKVGFRLFFSVHAETAMLKARSKDLWNCSVVNFADFKVHFPCDLQCQCVDMEDERYCPYTSDECGLGLINLEHYCLLFIRSANASSSWRDMEFACQKEGLRVATFRRFVDYERMVQYVEPMSAYWGFWMIAIGLHTASEFLPVMYKKEMQNSDGTIAFHKWVHSVNNIKSVCGSMVHAKDYKLYMTHVRVSFCSKKISKVFDVVCEIPKTLKASHEKVQLHQSVSRPERNTNLTLIGCPSGHVTRSFLVCDFQSSCWRPDVTSCSPPLTPLPSSFVCTNGFESVPYTLVCDVRPDCSDDSDESFCYFPPCDLPDTFPCSSRECVPWSVVCDGQRDCYNGLDEHLCSGLKTGSFVRPAPPAIVHLDRHGQFSVRKMTQLQLSDLSPETCPETHFQCPGNGYCMPVFLRCNGVLDCLGHEDEKDCKAYACPGFYRCRNSQVCVHTAHLCDGILQCPQNDDELLCDLICPESCICHGLEFFCRQPFHARNFTELRFLDGHGSGMKPTDLSENVMLVYLILSANELTSVSGMNFPNLRSLYLNDNQLKEIHLRDFILLPHLNMLSLSGNPLLDLFQPVTNPLNTNWKDRNFVSHVPLFEEDSVTFQTSRDHEMTETTSAEGSNSENISTGNHTLTSLLSLDLSGSPFRTLDPSFLSLLPNLHTLNLSGSQVEMVLDDGFQAVTQLRTLDLRGCPMTYFPRNVFQGLHQLETIHSDSYKLCCPAALPEGFLLKNCHAPSHDVSSCQALLGSDTYRVFLSLFAFLSLLGNCGCFMYHMFFRKDKRLVNFEVFVVHLCIADFLMGVYQSIIGVADRVFLGTYLWEDNAWKSSTTCKMAGFLSLVSSQVSALVIFLVTFERVVVIQFPLSSLRFGARSAQVASLFVWVVGCLISVIPLERRTVNWQFYGQTGICTPLSFNNTDSPANVYFFGVMVVTNFMVFIAIAAGQAFIFWSALEHLSSSKQTTKKTQDIIIAWRLFTVAMSNFICWFLIGVLGILAANGTDISGEISAAMAIYVLPLNSALNPFLYAINVVLENRRKADEERIKARLLAQFRAMGSEDEDMSFRNNRVEEQTKSPESVESQTSYRIR